MKSHDHPHNPSTAAVEDVGLDEPLPFDPNDDAPEPDHPSKLWVLLDSTDVPTHGHDYATPEEMLGRHVGQRNQQVRDAARAKPVRPMPAHWMSLEVAADVLGEESPDALRKKLVRAAQRTDDGTIEARLDGVAGRKLGKLWKVRLSAEWQDECRSSRGRR